MKQISIVLGTERDELEVLREVKERLKDLQGVQIVGFHCKPMFEKFEKNRGGNYERR